tara:strand:- start:11817 stop:13496 length:1680 start_codon:yes stop_codon:yes gene_type:complete
MSNIRKLKFAIICESTMLADWQVDTINELVKSNVAKLDLIIIAENDSSKKNNKPIVLKIIDKLFSRKNFYSLWQRTLKKDRKINLRDEEYFSDANVIKCNIKKKGKYRDYFDENDLLSIKKNNLDFILRFGLNIITGDILEVPKYGIWSFHHGDERKYRGRPACFWEMYNNENKIGGILQRLNEKLDSGVILKRWFIKNNKLSWKDNLEELRKYGTILPKQVCIDIINSNDNYFFNKPSKTTAKIRYLPTNKEMVFFAFTIIKNYILFFKKKFMIDSWKIGLIEEKIENYLFNDSKKEIKWFGSNDKNIFFADPFITKRNEDFIVYFEKFYHNKNRGAISQFLINKNKVIIDELDVIKDNNHYSFPFIFEEDNKLYLLPEQMSKNSVQLYKIDKNSGEVLSKNVILNNIKLSDPTIFSHNSKYWLFGTVDGIKLMAWYTNDIDSPWKEHMNNPIKIDISSSRNAGGLFYNDGELIRFSQDCSKEYGSRIALNKILELTKNSFHEETLKYIEPKSEWDYNEGLHTIGFTNDHIIIDAKKSIFHFETFIRKIIRKIGFKWI